MELGIRRSSIGYTLSLVSMKCDPDDFWVPHVPCTRVVTVCFDTPNFVRARSGLLICALLVILLMHVSVVAHTLTSGQLQGA